MALERFVRLSVPKRVSLSDDTLAAWETRLNQIEHFRTLTITAAAPLDSPGSFDALIAAEEEETSDGRIVAAQALTWRDPPLPLFAEMATVHSELALNAPEAPLVGAFDALRRETLQIWGTGWWDGTEDGQRAAGFVRDQQMIGVSMDVAVIDSEMQITEVDAEGFPVDGIFRLLKGEILGATQTGFPAIASAHIEWVGDGSAVTTPAPGEPQAVAASAGPLHPPAEWFTEPEVSSIDRSIHITPDGRVFGLVAPWSREHIGRPGTHAPRNTNGKFFELGAAMTAEGKEIGAGVLTMNCPHAGEFDTPQQAIDFYADTRFQVARLVVGTNHQGVWAAGAVLSDASPEQIERLRGAKFSGDWRMIDGQYQLVGITAVNTPGFPVVGTKVIVAGGKPLALIAAGAEYDMAPSRPDYHTVTVTEPQLKAVADFGEVLRADWLGPLETRMTRMERLLERFGPDIEQRLLASIGVGAPPPMSPRVMRRLSTLNQGTKLNEVESITLKGNKLGKDT